MGLNEELARWVGFSIIERQDPYWKDMRMTLTYPDGEWSFDEDEYPDFPSSLDACFKWIVPENAEVKIRENLIGQFTSVEVKTRDGKSGMGITRWDEESDRLKRTATSLCRAIEQLMDKEQSTKCLVCGDALDIQGQYGPDNEVEPDVHCPTCEANRMEAMQ